MIEPRSGSWAAAVRPTRATALEVGAPPATWSFSEAIADKNYKAETPGGKYFVQFLRLADVDIRGSALSNHAAQVRLMSDHRQLQAAREGSLYKLNSDPQLHVLAKEWLYSILQDAMDAPSLNGLSPLEEFFSDYVAELLVFVKGATKETLQQTVTALKGELFALETVKKHASNAAEEQKIKDQKFHIYVHHSKRMQKRVGAKLNAYFAEVVQLTTMELRKNSRAYRRALAMATALWEGTRSTETEVVLGQQKAKGEDAGGNKMSGEARVLKCLEIGSPEHTALMLLLGLDRGSIARLVQPILLQVVAQLSLDVTNGKLGHYPADDDARYDQIGEALIAAEEADEYADALLQDIEARRQREEKALLERRESARQNARDEMASLRADPDERSRETTAPFVSAAPEREGQSDPGANEPATKVEPISEGEAAVPIQEDEPADGSEGQEIDVEEEEEDAQDSIHPVNSQPVGKGKEPFGKKEKEAVGKGNTDPSAGEKAATIEKGPVEKGAAQKGASSKKGMVEKESAQDASVKGKPRKKQGPADEEVASAPGADSADEVEPVDAEPADEEEDEEPVDERPSDEDDEDEDGEPIDEPVDGKAPDEEEDDEPVDEPVDEKAPDEEEDDEPADEPVDEKAPDEEEDDEPVDEEAPDEEEEVQEIVCFSRFDCRGHGESAERADVSGNPGGDTYDFDLFRFSCAVEDQVAALNRIEREIAAWAGRQTLTQDEWLDWRNTERFAVGAASKAPPHSVKWCPLENVGHELEGVEEQVAETVQQWFHRFR
eukprot:g4234.t1